jgi:hypothetical protein
MIGLRWLSRVVFTLLGEWCVTFPVYEPQVHRPLRDVRLAYLALEVLRRLSGGLDASVRSRSLLRLCQRDDA